MSLETRRFELVRRQLVQLSLDFFRSLISYMKTSDNKRGQVCCLIWWVLSTSVSNPDPNWDPNQHRHTYTRAHTVETPI